MNKRILIAPRKSELQSQSQSALTEIQQYLNDKKYPECILKARTSLQIEPANHVYKKYLAFCLGQTGELHEAKAHWLELIEHDPFSEEYLLNLSLIEQKLGRIDSSIGLLKLAAEYHPSSTKPWMSLGEVYSSIGDIQKAVNASLKAIELQPDNAEIFQNLGSNFFSLAMFDEAKHAFETALLLKPEIQEAKSSLSSILFRNGHAKAAADLLEELITKHKPSDRMSLAQLKWNAALIHLRLGNLQKGWEYYEEGFNPEVQGTKTRNPHRSFQVPKWTPDLPKGQTVLVWREQGIGDDVIFMTCLDDLIKAGYVPLVECDKRMIDLVQRSFPNIQARESIYRIDYPHDSPFLDYDCHIPMGSLLSYFRPNLNSFNSRSGKYLKVNQDMRRVWLDRTNKIRNGKKLVGISWRGGLTDPVGQLKYSQIIDWIPLLSCDDFVFVNLQIGDCEQELKDIESMLKISIHRWSDLDLKNNLDDVCALISCLDEVVTISSAVWTFSAAVGASTSLLLSSPHWTMFDQNYTPFFSSVTCFCTNDNQPISRLMPKVKSHLQKLK